MNVGQLIKELSKYDKSLNVCMVDFNDVVKVHYMPTSSHSPECIVLTDEEEQEYYE